jgi:protein-S-isoprenylcysteine O-methyltransferase Ste14
LDSVIESVCILAATYPSALSSRILELLAFSSNKSASTFDPSFLWLIGMALAIGGGILRIAAFRALGDIWTSEPAVLKEHKLITNGPYAVSRHPAYTGLLGLMWGSTIALISPGSWTREILGRYVMASQDSWAMWTQLLALVMFGGQPIVVIAIAMTTREEEALLKRSFGKQWDKWARDTPWQIVPGVY